MALPAKAGAFCGMCFGAAGFAWQPVSRFVEVLLHGGFMSTEGTPPIGFQSGDFRTTESSLPRRWKTELGSGVESLE